MVVRVEYIPVVGALRVSAEHVSALSYGYMTAAFFVNVSAVGAVGKLVKVKIF